MADQPWPYHGSWAFHPQQEGLQVKRQFSREQERHAGGSGYRIFLHL